MPNEPLANPPSVSQIQAMARVDADALSKMEEAILPETWELNRWMLASLLALNSAAVAAVYSSNDVTHDIKIAACRLFIFGAVCALASGLSLTFDLQRRASHVSRAQRYWASVAIDGVRSIDEEASISAVAQKSNVVGFIPQIFLFLSTGLFIGGVLSL